MDKNIYIFIWKKKDFSDSQLAHFSRALSDEDQRRQHTLTQVNKKNEFIRGRFLLYSAITKICKQKYNLKKIKIKKSGKPYFTGGPAFSISHSRANIMLALCAHGELGADLECAEGSPMRVHTYAKIISRYSLSAELKKFLSLPKAQKKNHFYKIWTMKEAYAKVTGLGLGPHLKNYLNTNYWYYFKKQKNLHMAVCHRSTAGSAKKRVKFYTVEATAAGPLTYK